MSVGYQTAGSFSNEFEQINGNISANIYKIKKNISELTQFSRIIGSDKDTAQFRDRILSTIDDTTKLATSTSNYFKQLNSKKWGKSENLIIDRSKKTLKNEVENFGRISKEVSEKLRQSSPVSDNKTFLSFEDDDRDSTENTKLLQQQKQNDLSLKLDSVQDRERRIQNIESDIIDVNAIMKELSSLVTEQSSIIENISTNVESAHSQVETGNEELIKASKYASKYRKKVFILIIIALVIAIVIGVIIYLSVKK